MRLLVVNLGFILTSTQKLVINYWMKIVTNLIAYILVKFVKQIINFLELTKLS